MTDLWFGTRGPHDAEIVVVGEAWGLEESGAQKPFVGGAGNELNRMLAEANIDHNSVLMTNVVASRPQNNNMWRFFHAKDAAPPGSALRGLHPTQIVLDGIARLTEQIASHPRRLVIGTGNYPLWALSDCAGYDIPKLAEGRRCPNGIMNWRGSMWHTHAGVQFLPIVHPSAILRQWELRAPTLHDLKARVPMALRNDWRPNPMPLFWAPPTFDQACLKLRYWITQAQSGKKFKLVNDIETAKKLITVQGFADSANFAMAIPFVKDGSLASYWPIEQEIVLLDLIRRVLTHPNISITGQNWIYDVQYQDAYLAARPRTYEDTMLKHHLLWPGTPKGLDYLSSLYCNYHWYWKEDGKEWDTRGKISDLLVYNCWDCVRTFECDETLTQVISQLSLTTQWAQTRERAGLALRMMLKGVRIDRVRRARLKRELAEVHSALQGELLAIIPQRWLPPPKTKPSKGKGPVYWPSSPKQQKFVFGDLLGMRIPLSRKTGAPTLGGEVIPDMMRKYPEFREVFRRLEDLRSVAVFQSHFVDAELDGDDRMRCSYNPAGTETFRFNSSKNAFNRGTNLQNLPRGEEE